MWLIRSAGLAHASGVHGARHAALVHGMPSADSHAVYPHRRRHLHHRLPQLQQQVVETFPDLVLIRVGMDIRSRAWSVQVRQNTEMRCLWSPRQRHPRLYARHQRLATVGLHAARRRAVRLLTQPRGRSMTSTVTRRVAALPPPPSLQLGPRVLQGGVCPLGRRHRLQCRVCSRTGNSSEMRLRKTV